MKYVFIAAIATIIARGILGLIDPSALNAPTPPPLPEPVKGHVTVVAGGPAGTISGHIYDAKSGEVLVGTSAFIRGTDLGAATGVRGDYTLTGVPPGKYELVASCIGYNDLKTTVTPDSIAGLRVDLWLAVTTVLLGRPPR
ncbi:MAG: carboxypeptidase-like regulatory domain-containing protein [candidate division WOR-3 bacterium]|nr:carboxypeptidase-like regulatory domain-containing protein [candidate division WOR-3 bacterium]